MALEADSAETTPPRSIATLQNEAESLRYLLDRFFDDKSFVASGEGRRVVYFIDSHEVGAYIRPETDDLLRGFQFEFERMEEMASPGQRADLKFKSERTLRKLLLECRVQIGLLPSHGEEVDQDFLYHRMEWLKERIALVEAANYQLEQLRANEFSYKTLSEAARNEGLAEDTKRRLITFLGAAAPSVMALLRSEMVTPKERIDALVQKSNLCPLRAFSWTQLGLNAAQDKELKDLTPSRNRVDAWRAYLSHHPERQRNSRRANRVDAEAIASIEALNARLQEFVGDRIRVCLVTRAMTLINAARDQRGTRQAALRKVEFVRHPRLILFPGDQEIKLSDADERTLLVTLETFDLQLRTPQFSAQAFNEARDTFAAAWRDFERARLTLGLRQEAEKRDALHEVDLQQVLTWFVKDVDVERMVLEQIQGALRNFGLDTFTLVEPDQDTPKIAAQIIALEKPERCSVRPITAGIRGPVEFSARALGQHAGHRVEDLEALLKNLSASIPERYLAWAVLHACRNRWKLAEIYSMSVISVGRLMAEDSVTYEARLLLAQVRRLGGVDAASPEERDAILRSRAQTVRELLHRGGSRDPRALYESAAEILEAFLIVGDAKTPLPPLTEGLKMLAECQRLLGRVADDLLQVRVLELLVTYAIAGVRYPAHWPSEHGEVIVCARTWHKQLHELLVSQRSRLKPDEIPRRARAVEIIGFMFGEVAATAPAYLMALSRLLARPPLGILIPFEFRNFATKLCRDVSLSGDRIALLLARELRLIVRRLQRYRQPDLIYAPIWSGNMIQRFIEALEDTALQGRAKQGFEILALMGGPQQRGVDETDGPHLVEAAMIFAKLADQVREREMGPHGWVRYVCRMESSYARLLHTLIHRDSGQNRDELLELDREYQSITQDYPQASMPHFRRSIVLWQLGVEDSSMAELESAAQRVDTDPYLIDVANHWIRGTIQRRRVLLLAKHTADARARFVASPTAQLLEGYLALIRQVLAILCKDFALKSTEETHDGFAFLERRRRVNNIVYYCALYRETHRSLDGIEVPRLSDETLRELLEELHAEGIDAVPEKNIVHTIGYAYWSLGDTARTRQASDHLLDLMVDGVQEDAARYTHDLARWRHPPSVSDTVIMKILEKTPPTAIAAA